MRGWGERRRRKRKETHRHTIESPDRAARECRDNTSQSFNRNKNRDEPETTHPRSYIYDLLHSFVPGAPRENTKKTYANIMPDGEIFTGEWKKSL